jgi:hypothetical protein
MIAFQNIVPISLYITIEIVKTMQVSFEIMPADSITLNAKSITQRRSSSILIRNSTMLQLINHAFHEVGI